MPSVLFVCVHNAGRSQMAEEGIDISAEIPKVLTTEAVKESDVVIPMDCGGTRWAESSHSGPTPDAASR